MHALNHALAATAIAAALFIAGCDDETGDFSASASVDGSPTTGNRDETGEAASSASMAGCCEKEKPGAGAGVCPVTGKSTPGRSTNDCPMGASGGNVE